MLGPVGMLVADSSAIVAAALGAPDALEALAGDEVASLDLVRAECGHALARLVTAGAVPAGVAWDCLVDALGLVDDFYESSIALERAWALRDSLGFSDALHVGLAEAVGATLVTADARLARSRARRCPVSVVRRR